MKAVFNSWYVPQVTKLSLGYYDHIAGLCFFGHIVPFFLANDHQHGGLVARVPMVLVEEVTTIFRRPR